MFPVTSLRLLQPHVHFGHTRRIPHPIKLLVSRTWRHGLTNSWDDFTLTNWTGTAFRNRVVDLDCSSNHPCTGWRFNNFNITPGLSNETRISYFCNNMVINGSSGLDQCHPGTSDHEVRHGAGRGW